MRFGQPSSGQWRWAGARPSGLRRVPPASGLSTKSEPNAELTTVVPFDATYTGKASAGWARYARSKAVEAPHNPTKRAIRSCISNRCEHSVHQGAVVALGAFSVQLRWGKRAPAAPRRQYSWCTARAAAKVGTPVPGPGQPPKRGFRVRLSGAERTWERAADPRNA
jgi:hypothetical protein